MAQTKVTKATKKVESVATSVAAPAVEAAAPAAPAKVSKKAAAKAEAVAAPAAPVATEVAAPAAEAAATEESPKASRPKNRNYAEIFTTVRADVDAAYKHLQSAYRLINSLESAHKREVTHTKTRECGPRKPTIVFDAPLVAYYRARLGADDLVVSHKEGDASVEVNLGDLSTETRAHRTDVTQLYNRVFKKHKMQDSQDGRNIVYQNDKELVALLTTGGYKPELEADVQAIRDGKFKLTIFNIQRFTNHHLRKVEA
jgi:hypothetical protein